MYVCCLDICIVRARRSERLSVCMFACVGEGGREARARDRENGLVPVDFTRLTKSTLVAPPDRLCNANCRR